MRRFLIPLLLLALPAWAQSGIGLPPDSRGGQVPYLTRPQSWSQPQSLPPIVLTDGATIGVPPGSGSYFLTLTGGTLGSPHMIACPAGGLSNVRWLTFDITQSGGGGFPIAFDTCYGFPSFAPPVPTPDAGAITSVSCYSVPAGFGPMRCGPGLGPIGYGFLVRNNHALGALCASATTTCSVTLANSVTGDFRVIGIFWGGGTSNPTAADISSMTDEHGNNCSEVTSAFGAIPAGTRATDIWFCQINAGASSSTPTVTWGTNVPQYARMCAVEMPGAATSSPDAGLGNHNNGTSTALSVASNGTMPQADNFVFSMFKSEGGSGGTLSAGANTTLLDQGDSGSPEGCAYQIPATPGGVATNAANLSGSSQAWSASVAVFKHK